MHQIMAAQTEPEQDEQTDRQTLVAEPIGQGEQPPATFVPNTQALLFALPLFYIMLPIFHFVNIFIVISHIS